MKLKLIACFFCSSLIITSLHAQVKVVKPVRKGVMPVTTMKAPDGFKYSAENLNGKWQEVARQFGKQEPSMDFGDTLMLIIKKDTVEVKYGSNSTMNMKGPIGMESPDNLILAGDSYTLESLTKDMMVLNDGNAIRTLQKKKAFAYESFGKPAVKPDVYDTPIEISTTNVNGKWLVYRRKAAPADAGKNPPLIKSLDLKAEADGKTATGTIVTYHSNVSESLPCTVTFDKGNMNIRTSKNSWDIHTYKADGKEFIFGNAGELIYFSKH